MRKLFWQMMVSLDGFMEGPNHELDWHVVDEDYLRYVMGMLNSIDAIILGRKTYELFAKHWPAATSPEAPLMNSLPKIVFSNELEKAEWQNARLVKDDVLGEVGRLKAQPGKDLAVLGSAKLGSTLMQNGLVDEYRVFFNPVVLGAGVPMFRDMEARCRLKLVKTEMLKSGVVILYYRH